uniref:CSON005894 protein n=1 Tax=Culicoides sonorensis TaxID=179676 RepID=A0A336M0U6_CULSO
MAEAEENTNNKPYKIKDATRAVKKSLVASSLDEVRRKSAEKFDKIDLPNIHLDCDGTEIDDEDYFQTLEPNTELIAVFPGEQWIDVSKLMKVHTQIDVPREKNSSSPHHDEETGKGRKTTTLSSSSHTRDKTLQATYSIEGPDTSEEQSTTDNQSNL